MIASNTQISWRRYSLRELLLVIGFFAIACVSLKYADRVWELVLSASLSLLLMGAAVTAFVDGGRRQAAAIGFTVVVVLYAIAFWSGAPNEGVGRNSELDLRRGKLPSTTALALLFPHIVQDSWVDPEGAPIPGYVPMENDAQLAIHVGSGRFNDPNARFVEVPNRSDFMAVGHLLWTLLLGYLGSRLALYCYDRRTKGDNQHSCGAEP